MWPLFNLSQPSLTSWTFLTCLDLPTPSLTTPNLSESSLSYLALSWLTLANLTYHDLVWPLSPYHRVYSCCAWPTSSAGCHLSVTRCTSLTLWGRLCLGVILGWVFLGEECWGKWEMRSGRDSGSWNGEERVMENVGDEFKGEPKNEETARG